MRKSAFRKHDDNWNDKYTKPKGVQNYSFEISISADGGSADY